jgi:hypothetical protein
VPWLEPWVLFDAAYNLAVDRHGDERSTDAPGLDVRFLPLLPACIAITRAIGINLVLGAVLIPNPAFVGGLACDGRVVLRVFADARTVW